MANDGMLKLFPFQDEEERERELLIARAKDPSFARGYHSAQAGQGANAAVRGLLSQATGTDLSTPAEKQRAAKQAIAAKIASSGARPGSDEYWQLMTSELQKAGMVDHANAAQKAWDQQKLTHAQTGQANRANMPHGLAVLQERYNEVVMKLEQDPHNRTLLAAKANILEALRNAKGEQVWDEIQAVHHEGRLVSPGYLYNKITGEKRPLNSTSTANQPAPGPFDHLPEEMRKAAEKDAGRNVSQWVSGGRDGALKGLEALRDVADKLNPKSANYDPSLVDDPLSSYAPDGVRLAVGGVFGGKGAERAIQARDTVRTAVQSTLKEVMGHQYTEKEGTDMFNRAWDSKLGPAANLDRITRTIKELEGRMKAKDQLVRATLPHARPVAPPGQGGAADIPAAPSGPNASQRAAAGAKQAWQWVDGKLQRVK